MNKKVLFKEKPDSRYGNIYFIKQDEEDYNDYYKLEKILSFNKVFMLVIGTRSSGKSYESKDFIFKQFLKYGRESIYLRRSMAEINRMAIERYWDDYKAEHPELDGEFTFKYDENGSQSFYNGERLLDFLTLNKSSIYKSIPFQNKWWVIFDEFNISVNRFMNYLSDEINRFMEIYGTVKRPYNNGKKQIIPKTRVIFLGNNMEKSNPYVRYFDLEYGDEPGFYFNDIAIVQVFKNNKSAEVYNDALGNTDYGDYAINNKTFNNKDFLIKKRPKEAKNQWNFISEKIKCTVSYYNGSFYITKYIPNANLTFFRDKDDNIEKLLKDYNVFKSLQFYTKIKRYIGYNAIYYESEAVMDLFNKFMRLY